MKKHVLATLVTLIFITGCAAKITGAKILKYGICTATTTKTVKAKGTKSGKLHYRKDLEFLEITTEIPLGIGTSFGIRYVIEGKPEGR